MAGLSLAADMPRKSFLLVPLEATDPVVEDGDEVRQGMQYSGVSPTPRKSLFEMDANDLRAAEQAWLEKVGSFRVPKPHIALCTRHSSEELSAQQQKRTFPGTGAPADGANVTVAIPCASSSELRQPQQSAIKASEGWSSGIEGIAYTESDNAAAFPVSEAQSPQLLADEQHSSMSSHDSLTLRQRFSLVQAARVLDSASPSALPNLSSVQDLASPQEDAPPAGRAESAQVAAGHDQVRDGCAHEVMGSVQDADTSDAEPSEVASDPSQEPSIAAGTFHMPRTPWMTLKAVRRPSASWARGPQLPVQEPWDRTSTASLVQAALPHQAQGFSSRPTSGQTLVHGTEQAAKQQQTCEPPSSEGEEAASAATSGLLNCSAEKEHSSAYSDIDTEKTGGMYDEPGWKPRMSEQQIVTQSSAGGTLPSKSGSFLAPDARLSSSPAITTSLESAAPSAMDRRKHSQGRLEAWHGQADGSRIGESPAVTRERRARPLLRGRTPDECGVKMYERALAAEQRRQARANTLRRELAAAADAACTFSPRLNTEKTNRMLWKSMLSVPVASATSQSRTAVQQYSPVAESAGGGAAHQPPASAEPGPHVRSSHHRSMSGIAAGQRLYTSGLAGLERQRTTASVHNQRELESLRAASPRARSLPRAIYGAAALARIDLIRSHAISPHRRKPAYEDMVKECTFQPVTTWRSLSRAAMSGIQTAEAGLDLTTASSEADLSRFLHRASLKPSDAETALGPDGSSAAPASLTPAYMLEQHSASVLAGQAVKQKQVTDPSSSWASAVKSKQPGSEQMGRGARTGQLDRKRGQHGQVGSSPARTATWKISEQLDFAEFLHRQLNHLQMHNHQVERTRVQISEEVQRGLGISPGSRALLKRWTSVPVHKKALHSQRSAPGQLKSTPLVHSWTADTALRPPITAKARLRRAHTIAELHDGGTSRREHALEQLRAENVLAEEKHLTFRPSINHYYHTSRPQLRLSNPAPYLAHVQAKALKRRVSLLRMRAAAEEVELKECTHSPQTTKLPAFIQRLARDFAADPDKHPKHADGLISPRSEDEGLGHLFTILQPEWR